MIDIAGGVSLNPEIFKLSCMVWSELRDQCL